ncbi:MAG: hypothetical protein ACI9Z4_000105 [Polaribacter sp.]|jgi:hypothetical protein
MSLKFSCALEKDTTPKIIAASKPKRKPSNKNF